MSKVVEKHSCLAGSVIKLGIILFLRVSVGFFRSNPFWVCKPIMLVVIKKISVHCYQTNVPFLRKNVLFGRFLSKIAIKLCIKNLR